MSRSYHKTPYNPAGKRRKQMTKEHHRIARAKFKRDENLVHSHYKKIESDINWELHAGHLGPSWAEYKIERRKEDPYTSTKSLRREYHKLYLSK